MDVFISAAVKFKLWTIIDSLKTEVGGFGYAYLEGEDVVWEDVFLVQQEATGSAVDFTGGGIGEAIERAVKDGAMEKPGFVWASWHSHNSMKAFWSATDEDCIKTYGEAGIPMLLSFVGNHKHEYRCRLDMFNVSHFGVNVDQVTMDELSMYEDLTDPVLRSLHDEIKAKVKDPPKKDWSKKKPETKKDDTPGDKLDSAFAVKGLMEAGLTYHEAKSLVEAEGTEWFIGPDGLVELDGNCEGFDSMAWGVSATDPA